MGCWSIFPATPHTNAVTTGPLDHSYRISFGTYTIRHAPYTPLVLSYSKLFSPSPILMVPLLLPAGYLIAQHTLHWTLYSTAIQKDPCHVLPCTHGSMSLKPSSRKVSCQCSFTSSCTFNGIVSVLPSSYKSASCPWPCLGLRWSHR